MSVQCMQPIRSLVHVGSRPLSNESIKLATTKRELCTPNDEVALVLEALLCCSSLCDRLALFSELEALLQHIGFTYSQTVKRNLVSRLMFKTRNPQNYKCDTKTKIAPHLNTLSLGVTCRHMFVHC